ncbi:winged helix-turn-helix domain-containing protein [Pseudoalteromonas fenneropenaei]|uniref:Winged helix-turn-helix domain-containing protein n=1 Tax=Pseudoalteromonas fenneropenaei TaxID=1737459 RepID=A0ABV7CI17_9GAMM
MTKILFNERNEAVFSQYRTFLARYGFDVLQLQDISEWPSYRGCEVIILDGELTELTHYLPDLRGKYQGGIVVSSNAADEATQIISLELGADDVISRSVKPRMLAAKLNALLRRLKCTESQEQTGIIRLGRLFIDRLNRRVQLADQDIMLTSHEYELLVILAENAGKVIDRDKLFEQILGRPYDGIGRSIDVRVSKLRKKLLDNEGCPERIKTVWKQGYCLVPDAW